jgi:RNA polymerase sigma-70 factor (ECF subfamily)
MLAAFIDAARQPPPGAARRETSAPVAEPTASGTDPLCFEAVYEEYFDFVWRSLRRLGVLDASLDDAAQDVFIVVHNKLESFEARASVKTWLFGITLRVAARYRRTARRRDAGTLPDTIPDLYGPGPHEATAQAEAVRLLHALLDTLGDDRRAVFVMMELEQMSAPEVADALGVSLNTVYSRLRKARSEFESALARHRRRSTRP